MLPKSIDQGLFSKLSFRSFHGFRGFLASLQNWNLQCIKGLFSKLRRGFRGFEREKRTPPFLNNPVVASTSAIPSVSLGKCSMPSGTVLAILNRESGDSELGDSNREIPRSQPNIDRLRFRWAILNRISAILLYCNSTHFCASHCGNSGDSWPAILGIVRFATRS